MDDAVDAVMMQLMLDDTMKLDDAVMLMMQ